MDQRIMREAGEKTEFERQKEKLGLPGLPVDTFEICREVCQNDGRRMRVN